MQKNSGNIRLDPTKWVENYGDQMYHYTFKRVMGQEIAEDIVQESFLAALKGVQRFKGNSSEKTWLFAILKNKIIDHYRKKSKSSTSSLTIESPFMDDGLMLKHWEKDRGPGEWSPDYEKQEEKELFRKIFKLCLSFLPPKMSAVFSLKIIEECDSDQVCKELDISSSNFWVLMHRARLQLRECMEDKWLNN